ncbi:hypothetical protein [Pseudomonas sp. SID14000]|uniref:hypothetical protein n=1 Tax=Pseudomonas sp. SID14000 TaxID=1986221 RepID=UPI000B3C94A5|nr:hypothetical protein [Pseudomonas sp. SID14000]
MLQISFGLDADWVKNETSTTQHRLVRMKTVELFTQYRFKATIGRLPKRQGAVAFTTTAWQHH